MKRRGCLFYMKEKYPKLKKGPAKHDGLDLDHDTFGLT